MASDKRGMISFSQVAEIQATSSRLEVQSVHLNTDLQLCQRTRSEMAAEAAKQLELKQKTHDDQVGCLSLCIDVSVWVGNGNQGRDPGNKLISSVMKLPLPL